MIKIKNLFLVISILIFILLSGISCAKSSSSLGVFKSEDEGKTWQQKVTIDKKKSIKNIEIISIKINPVDSKIIFIGAKEKGLYRTLDGGETWQQTPLNNGDIYSVDIDPKAANIIYAAGYFGTLGKIYKSDNNGEDFKEIYSETHAKTSVLSLGIDSYDTRKVYAGTSEGALLKSVDSGRSWILQNRLKSEITCIAINPHDTRHILIGTDSGGIFKTENGGEEWKSLEENLKGFNKTNKVHSLVFDPKVPGRVYFGSLEGLLVSENEGESWKKIDILTQPDKKSFLGVAIDYSDKPNIYLGLDSAIYKTSDGGQSWEVNRITTGLILALACDPLNNQIIYAGIAKEEKKY